MHGATAWYILAPDTIDESMYDLLDKKRRIVNAVIDGVEDEGGAGSVMSDLMLSLAERGMRK
jgi:hypothetical protein